MSSFKQVVLCALGSRLMAQVRVDDVEVISNQFRLISLSSETFAGAMMPPAAKIRLNAGHWQMRAYTPLSVDAVAGRVQILAYLHGDGPGSIWARSASPGDSTHMLGLQESLKRAGLSQPAVFFGDETSLAAAKTLQSHLPPGDMRFVLEVSDLREAQTIADRLALRETDFHVRQTDDAHLPSITEAIQRALASLATPHLVLTGNGHSIQAIRARLRACHAGALDYRVKAYWTPGKVGLE